MTNQWLIAVDPGKRACGVCIHDSRSVVQATLVEEPCGDPEILAAQVLAVVKVSGAPLKGLAWRMERPRKYAHASDKHYDLESLERVLDALAKLARAAGGRVTFYYPSQWKGNVPKAVCQARIRPTLSTNEIAAILDDHNVWDAVGICLVARGRLARGLVARR